MKRIAFIIMALVMAFAANAQFEKGKGYIGASMSGIDISNQTLSVFMLWAVTVYLVRQKKPYVITLIPAIFMTLVCTTFLLSEQVFSLDLSYALIIAAVTGIVAIAWFCIWYRKDVKR